MRRTVLTRMLPVSLALLLASSPHVRAQTASAAADTLLSRARVALNDLQYGRAQLLARELLASTGAVSTAQHRDALMILAAAYYPEEQEGRHADTATVFLRQLVRLDDTAKLPKDITWPGLDSLLEVERGKTFTVKVALPRESALVGPGAEATIRSTSRRVARYRLSLVPATGETIVVDSSGPTLSAALKLHVFDGARVAIASGQYVVSVIGTDAQTGETQEHRYAATIEAPALALEAVPGAVDQSLLKPERFPPKRGLAFASAVLLGGATVGMAVGMRADEPIKSTFSLDSKAIAAGAALAAGAIWAGFRDQGGPLPENVAANDIVRRAHEQKVEQMKALNADKVKNYRATVTISSEEQR